MSFSFVDQIYELEPGRRGRGGYRLPAGWRELPAWLVAEAIGQLASWVAMAGADFQRRPVAAIAGEVIAPPAVAGGSALELEAEVEQRDENAIVYRGSARLDGRPVGSLNRCVGPMLPMEEFDDPEAARHRCAALRAGAVAPRAYEDPMRLLVPTPVAHVRGELLRARLVVPRDAPFFADHFPRKPVFPATLLMDLQVRLAIELTAEAIGARPRLSSARHVKVRSFTSPGAVLDLEAKLQGLGEGRAVVAVRASAGERTVATARIELEATRGV